MKFFSLVILLSLISPTSYSGEGSTEGGPRMRAAGKSVEVSKNQISDVRLKNGSVIPLKELLSKNSSSIEETSTAIKFGFSKKSPIADVQLVSGDIIDLTSNSESLSGDGDSGGN